MVASLFSKIVAVISSLTLLDRAGSTINDRAGNTIETRV